MYKVQYLLTSTKYLTNENSKKKTNIVLIS